MGVHGFPILSPLPTSHLPPHPIPLGHPSAPALSALSHALNLDWGFISHVVIYMFQCSLKSFHLRLLPQSPKVCSLHLCLFCCLAPSGLQSMGSLRVGRLSDFTFTFHFHALEKEMATHSSVLAWRIPGMVEPGGLLSMGSYRVRHN